MTREATVNTTEKYNPEDLASALKTLEDGGLILYPTDTVWGIGCDACNDEAIRRVFALKRRSDAKALISIVPNDAALERLVEEVPPLAYDLLDMASTPLTIIYDRVKGLSPLLLAEDGSAGIRVVKEPFCQALLQRFRKPLVSTSANISGAATPKSFREIDSAIIEGVDYVVKYRQKDQRPHQASKIMKLSVDGSFKIIR